MEAMDVSGIGSASSFSYSLSFSEPGFVSQEAFVKRLLAEGYCVSEFEVSLGAYLTRS